MGISDLENKPVYFIKLIIYFPYCLAILLLGIYVLPGI